MQKTNETLQSSGIEESTQGKAKVKHHDRDYDREYLSVKIPVISIKRHMIVGRDVI